MKTPLSDWSIHHAGVKPVFHPRLKTVVNGQTAVRYMRFLRPVAIDQLELRHERHGRWVPGTPTHPAHLIISVLNPRTGHWNTVREVDLPRDPRIEGRGLNQRMSIEQMNAHFDRVLKESRHIIRLDSLKTDHHPQFTESLRQRARPGSSRAEALSRPPCRLGPTSRPKRHARPAGAVDARV
jgi:hypothetical protein